MYLTLPGELYDLEILLLNGFSLENTSNQTKSEKVKNADEIEIVDIPRETQKKGSFLILTVLRSHGEEGE